METLSKVFNYNGSKITFNKGNAVMVNATEMAKQFGKQPKDFLKTEQTKKFIAALSEVKKILSSDLVRVTYGDNGGTWMHEDVALEFARWLSPAFAIWCNDRIKELLTTGVTTLADDDATIAQAMAILQKRLDKANADKAQLEADNQHKQATIESQATELEKQAPKVAYVDNVLQSVNTYNTNLIAKELGMSAETLNKKLQEIGVQYRQGGVWVLMHKYQGKGYTKTRTHTYTRSVGSTGTSMLTVWTERGRAFIHQVIESAANKMAMAAACK